MLHARSLTRVVSYGWQRSLGAGSAQHGIQKQSADPTTTEGQFASSTHDVFGGPRQVVQLSSDQLQERSRHLWAQGRIDEPLCVVCLGILKYLTCWPLFDDVSVLHDDDIVAESLNNL